MPRPLVSDPLVLDNFDIVQHIASSRRVDRSDEEVADDLEVDGAASRGKRYDVRSLLRSRSLSPPRRRSPRLSPPEDVSDVSVDRRGRTRAARAARREDERSPSRPRVKKCVRDRMASADPIRISTSPSDYIVTSSGWSGVRDTASTFIPARAYYLPELLGVLGMTEIEWDGQASRPIVDRERRVIGVLGGRPRGSEYLGLTEQAAEVLEQTRAQGSFQPNQRTGRRGEFTAVTSGISYGNGRQAPGNLRLRPTLLWTMHQLFAMSCFARISGFANSLFHTWNPDVYRLYETTLDALVDNHDALRRNFLRRDSVFAAATFNFGPNTITNPHVDTLNLAWGWCTITALGPFDPTRGGHLVLWDLGLVIRFPPGSTILIPSAILRHSNVPIQEGERRYSFTQFSAAGLFRWVDNNFRSDAAVNDEIRDDPEAQADRARARRTRWMTGINSFMRFGANA